MTKLLFYTTLLILCIFALPAKAQHEANWESINQRPYPQWFSDAKLGIFIHWSVSSVPAYGGKESYGEWFLRGLQLGDTTRLNFQQRVFGKDFQYSDYAPLLKGELFDANEWATLFAKAGARYVVLVAKHHDGFCLWPSTHQPNWNSLSVGPHRDIVGELTRAVRGKGLKMGLYYSLPEWNNPLHRWYTDPDSNITRYVDEYMIPQFKELVNTYKPSLIFADGEWRNSAKEWHAAELISWYYNSIGDEAIVNNRWGHGSNTGFLTPEYSSGMEKSDRPWAEVRGLGRSFGLNRNEKLEAYMTPQELIHFFIGAVSNGGGITLNVGPAADGQIPLLQQERLVQLGNWLSINGEAIYGSRAWQITHDEEPVSFTRVDSVIQFDWVRNAPMKGMKEDDFNIRWTGFIEAPVSGKYTFACKADDALSVSIDGKVQLKQGKTNQEQADGEVMGYQSKEQAENIIKLEKGRRYAIDIQYEEHKQNASVLLQWQLPGGNKETIPSSVFFTDLKNSNHGLNGTYHSSRSYLCYTQNHGNVYAIAMRWPGKELLIPHALENIKEVKLLGSGKTIPFSMDAGGIRLDLSNIYHNDLPCDYAWVFKIIFSD